MHKPLLATLETSDGLWEILDVFAVGSCSGLLGSRRGQHVLVSLTGCIVPKP